MSNVRGGDVGFPGTSAAASQTPIRDVKMPPLGHFNVKDSAKEGKKRRGGPGAPSTLGSSISGSSIVADGARIGDSQNGRIAAMQNGNANKVSLVAFMFWGGLVEFSDEST